MPNDREHAVVTGNARRAYHLSATEVLAVIEGDTTLPSWSWVQQHSQSCEECRREIDAMRGGLEANAEEAPDGGALLLEGRAYRLIQTDDDPWLFEVAALKVTALIELKTRYSGDQNALGVVQTPGRSFTFAFDKLVDQRISIRDHDTGEAPLRLAAATRGPVTARRSARSLWPAFRRTEEPTCEFFGDFSDNMYLRLAPLAEEG